MLTELDDVPFSVGRCWASSTNSGAIRPISSDIGQFRATPTHVGRIRPYVVRIRPFVVRFRPKLLGDIDCCYAEFTQCLCDVDQVCFDFDPCRPLLTHLPWLGVGNMSGNRRWKKGIVTQIRALSAFLRGQIRMVELRAGPGDSHHRTEILRAILRHAPIEGRRFGAESRVRQEGERRGKKRSRAEEG